MSIHTESCNDLEMTEARSQHNIYSPTSSYPAFSREVKYIFNSPNESHDEDKDYSHIHPRSKQNYPPHTSHVLSSCSQLPAKDSSKTPHISREENVFDPLQHAPPQYVVLSRANSVLSNISRARGPVTSHLEEALYSSTRGPVLSKASTLSDHGHRDGAYLSPNSEDFLYPSSKPSHLLLNNYMLFSQHPQNLQKSSNFHHDMLNKHTRNIGLSTLQNHHQMGSIHTSHHHQQPHPPVNEPPHAQEQHNHIQEPPYPMPPRYSYQQHSRRKTWSPPVLQMSLVNASTHGSRVCCSNDSLDVAEECSVERKTQSLSEDLDVTPPRLAPVSGVLAQKPGQNVIRPVAFKPTHASSALCPVGHVTRRQPGTDAHVNGSYDTTRSHNVNPGADIMATQAIPDFNSGRPNVGAFSSMGKFQHHSFAGGCTTQTPINSHHSIDNINHSYPLISHCQTVNEDNMHSSSQHNTSLNGHHSASMNFYSNIPVTSSINGHTPHISGYVSQMADHTSHSCSHAPQMSDHTSHSSSHTSNLSAHNFQISGSNAHLASHIPHISNHTSHISDHASHISGHTHHISGHASHFSDHTHQKSGQTSQMSDHTSHSSSHASNLSNHNSQISGSTSHIANHTPHISNHTSHVFNSEDSSIFEEVPTSSERPASVPSLNISRVSSHGAEGMFQTPSPSDSGVGELEAMLREKDAEINTLREVMERNERAIFQVYEERRNVWLHETQELQNEYERRLKVQSRKSYKTEQVLSLQVYKLQQEQKSLLDDKSKVLGEQDTLRQEVEESQKLITHLKQNVEAILAGKGVGENQIEGTGDEGGQNTVSFSQEEELASNNNDVIVLKSQLHSFQIDMEKKNKEMAEQFRELSSKTDEVKSLKNELLSLKHRPSLSETSTQTSELLTSEDTAFLVLEESNRAISDLQEQLMIIQEQVVQLKEEQEKEREQWLDEKNKVIRYQKQLQLNYVQMQRKNAALETEVEQLTMELENRDMKLIALGGEESVC